MVENPKSVRLGGIRESNLCPCIKLISKSDDESRSRLRLMRLMVKRTRRRRVQGGVDFNKLRPNHAIVPHFSPLITSLISTVFHRRIILVYPTSFSTVLPFRLLSCFAHRYTPSSTIQTLENPHLLRCNSSHKGQSVKLVHPFRDGTPS
jgi:hypothetical protein